MGEIDWKLVLGAPAALLGALAVIVPLARSDAPPWASRSTVSDGFRVLHIDILDARLFNLRREQCAAIRRSDMTLAATIGGQIQKYRLEYYRLQDGDYDIRPCEEF